MSKSQAIAFFEEISKNKQLAQEVEKVIVGKNSDEAKAKELLSLAKEHGFNFTRKEAASAQGELKKSLSPEELLDVSGGKGGLKSSLMAMAMLAGLGVGGAAMSSMETNADGPGSAQSQPAAWQQQEGNAQPGQQQQGAEGNQEQPGQQEVDENREQPTQQEDANGNQEQRSIFAKAFSWVRSAGSAFFSVVTGSLAVEVDKPGIVVVKNKGDTVFVDGDREVQVNGKGPVEVNNNGDPVLVEGDREVHVFGPGRQNVNIEGDRPTTVWGGSQTDVLGSGLSVVLGSGGVVIAHPGGHGPGEEAEISINEPELLNPNRGPNEKAVYAPRDVALNEVRTVVINGAEQVDINCQCDVTHNGSGGQLTVTGSASISAEGTNRVNAGADSTIYSVSSNLFTHDGMGGGIIDGGDIEFSGFTEERMTRDVTVQSANSVTVASGLTMRTQNGTEFTMGETLQETAENILLKLSPNSLQEILSKFGSSSGGK